MALKDKIISIEKVNGGTITHIERALDYSKIDDIEIDGIRAGAHHDDWCDAYIASATYDGRPMADEELDYINDDSDFVYQAVEKWVY